jgi:hypothetical protein
LGPFATTEQVRQAVQDETEAKLHITSQTIHFLKGSVVVGSE